MFYVESHVDLTAPQIVKKGPSFKFSFAILVVTHLKILWVMEPMSG